MRFFKWIECFKREVYNIVYNVLNIIAKHYSAAFAPERSRGGLLVCNKVKPTSYILVQNQKFLGLMTFKEKKRK
jgi:hypothetical protein